MFRKRPDQIRGIAGSLDGRHIVVADGTTGPGPGIVRVLADAGATVHFFGNAEPAIDLQLRALGHPPGAITATALPNGWPPADEIGPAAPPFEIVVANPSHLDLVSAPAAGLLGPIEAVQYAETAATSLRDTGRTGAIVLVTGIDHGRAGAAAIAYLTTEMERLARVYAPNGIRVNAVAPGHVATNRRNRAVTSRTAPLGHVSVHPVEVGKAVWFLVNEDLSAGITGSTLRIDRGAALLRPEW